MTSSSGAVRVIPEVERGTMVASVVLAAPPERVFQALASEEVTDWWVRPGVFDTREWSADLRAGGRWEASGVGGAGPYRLEGEFLEVDPPRRLAHTWRAVGSPATTAVTYDLEAFEGGTRVTLRHSGFTSAEQCAGTCAGWETSFERLAQRLAAE
jgi:uncharacterized protein YndB with AHSA1/START domain